MRFDLGDILDRGVLIIKLEEEEVKAFMKKTHKTPLIFDLSAITEREDIHSLTYSLDLAQIIIDKYDLKFK